MLLWIYCDVKKTVKNLGRSLLIELKGKYEGLISAHCKTLITFK